MEFTKEYILSQILTIIMYIFATLTYCVKNRKNVLLLNGAGLICIGIAYTLLNAWSGLVMNCVALLRNLIFLIDEKKNGIREKNNMLDVIILIALFTISIVSAIFTYNGFFSLFSVFATMIYTFSVWQKNTKIYKLLGTPVSICWIIYNVYVFSITGMVLETCVLISAIQGYMLELKSNKLNAEKIQN